LGSIIWPILGILFVPWTTLAFLIVWLPVTGIFGLDWMWIALGAQVDLGTYGGGRDSNRDWLWDYARSNRV
jgi:hypothetical protein